MKYRAIDIASFFIKKGVTPLKLQKLLYYSQVWYFVKYRNPLFGDDLQAWIYGPVVYDVWNNLRFIKRSAIIPNNKAVDVDFTKDVCTHLNDVWDSYGSLSGSQLVDLTHNELPWKQSRYGALDNQPSTNPIYINCFTTKDFKLTSQQRIPRINKDGNALGNFSNV
ncbi:Panacea domain-containing protein [Marinilabilia salmonicolor]|uniref:Panacea domain-containing protein n=1 Tax=Marinilabilia salmonicolor TaxID=989 RepID=UPI00029A3E6C|nr:type II toxin-antitoxin system antitoxin SocA domain-containing protein [Marinilabilia salmonicolor]